MFLFAHLRGLLTNLLFTLATLLVFVPLLPLALLKLIPWTPWQRLCRRWLAALASAWINFNSWHQSWLAGARIELEGDLDLRRDEWYLMVSNHQSWVDILAILRVFNGRIPYVKFFLKKSLIWVPMLGVAWWALDYPFMRRYSKEQLERNPALKGKDIEETRRACEKFRDIPVSIINFLEGTRFTPAKHRVQQSPYQRLLIPRAGGVAFALNAMNGQLHRLLDVTIYYPEGIPTYWDYACGRVKRIRLHVKQRPLPPELLGDYLEDSAFRANFQSWVNQLWEEKDRQLAIMAEEERGKQG
jgi:1-acyl-sn-glycerol-3-phosphate acyltransferase